MANMWCRRAGWCTLSPFREIRKSAESRQTEWLSLPAYCTGEGLIFFSIDVEADPPRCGRDSQRFGAVQLWAGNMAHCFASSRYTAENPAYPRLSRFIAAGNTKRKAGLSTPERMMRRELTFSGPARVTFLLTWGNATVYVSLPFIRHSPGLLRENAGACL